MIRKVSMALALAGVLQMASGTQAGVTDLLVDGSFEAANLNPTPGSNYVHAGTGANDFGTTSGALPGSPSWTVTSSGGTGNGVMIGGVAGSTNIGYFGPSPGYSLPADPLTSGATNESAGIHVAYFVGDGETVSLSQTLTGLTAGKTYTFGFDAAVTWSSRNNRNESQLLAVIGGNTVLTETSASIGLPTSSTSQNSWKHFEGTYTAIAPSLTFGFVYIGGGNATSAAKDILVDRVFVGQAVPEPGTIALAAIVSGIGGIAYRRTRKNAKV